MKHLYGVSDLTRSICCFELATHAADLHSTLLVGCTEQARSMLQLHIMPSACSRPPLCRCHISVTTAQHGPSTLHPTDPRLPLLSPIPSPPLHTSLQANLATGRANMPSGKSLLQLWVERVLNTFSALVAWPVESLRMDDLYR